MLDSLYLLNKYIKNISIDIYPEWFCLSFVIGTSNLDTSSRNTFWANQSLWWLDSTDHSLVVQGVSKEWASPHFMVKHLVTPERVKTATSPKAYFLLPLWGEDQYGVYSWEHFVKIYYLEKTNHSIRLKIKLLEGMVL